MSNLEILVTAPGTPEREFIKSVSRDLNLDGLQVQALIRNMREYVKFKNNQSNSQLVMAHEFILKTAGKSNDPSYVKCPDHWHDLGWEKDLRTYTDQYAR